MKKIKFSQKLFNYSLFCGLLCAVFLSFSHFNAACDDLRANVLRLHIIANSNSAEDQELKLKIRDEILKQSDSIFANSSEIDAAIINAKNSLGQIEKIANKVLVENNLSYKATAKVENCFFETREYDDFTLPAGNYESLVITLGKAKGKNWWCVIFPEICLPAASSATLSDTTSQESAMIAESKNKYIMRFKAVEIYENIKKRYQRHKNQ